MTNNNASVNFVVRSKTGNGQWETLFKGEDHSKAVKAKENFIAKQVQLGGEVVIPGSENQTTTLTHLGKTIKVGVYTSQGTSINKTKTSIDIEGKAFKDYRYCLSKHGWAPSGLEFVFRVNRDQIIGLERHFWEVKGQKCSKVYLVIIGRTKEGVVSLRYLGHKKPAERQILRTVTVNGEEKLLSDEGKVRVIKNITLKYFRDISLVCRAANDGKLDDIIKEFKTPIQETAMVESPRLNDEEATIVASLFGEEDN